MPGVPDVSWRPLSDRIWSEDFIPLLSRNWSSYYLLVVRRCGVR